METSIERYFFVDYENVHSGGLAGVNNLSASDCVRIYYSNSADSLPMSILSSKVQFACIHEDMPVKNAVDCHILFDLREMAKQNAAAHFYIVSKDGDYDKAIEMFRAGGLSIDKIEMLSDVKIKTAQQPQKPKKQENPKKQDKQPKSARSQESDRRDEVKAFVNTHFSDWGDTDREIIVEAIVSSSTKQQIHNALMQSFYNEDVKQIYHEIKPLIKSLPGS